MKFIYIIKCILPGFRCCISVGYDRRRHYGIFLWTSLSYLCIWYRNYLKNGD